MGIMYGILLTVPECMGEDDPLWRLPYADTPAPLEQGSLTCSCINMRKERRMIHEQFWEKG